MINFHMLLFFLGEHQIIVFVEIEFYLYLMGPPCFAFTHGVRAVDIRIPSNMVYIGSFES
jgi:hypothetical protein